MRSEVPRRSSRVRRLAGTKSQASAEIVGHIRKRRRSLRTHTAKRERSTRTTKQRGVLVDLTAQACPSYNKFEDTTFKREAKYVSYALTQLPCQKRKALMDALMGLNEAEMDIVDEVLKVSRQAKRVEEHDQSNWQIFVREVKIRFPHSYDRWMLCCI